jgi:hypothetical protein
VALKACLAIAAQTGKTLMKNVKITRNTKTGSRPKISGNNHIETVKKQNREKPGWDEG